MFVGLCSHRKIPPCLLASSCSQFCVTWLHIELYLIHCFFRMLHTFSLECGLYWSWVALLHCFFSVCFFLCGTAQSVSLDRTSWLEVPQLLSSPNVKLSSIPFWSCFHMFLLLSWFGYKLIKLDKESLVGVSASLIHGVHCVACLCFCVGMAFQDLFSHCKEAFLVSSDQALRAQLTEFFDHKLMKMKKVCFAWSLHMYSHSFSLLGAVFSFFCGSGSKSAPHYWTVLSGYFSVLCCWGALSCLIGLVLRDNFHWSMIVLVTRECAEVY